jgi:hypothetical protein
MHLQLRRARGTWAVGYPKQNTGDLIALTISIPRKKHSPRTLSLVNDKAQGASVSSQIRTIDFRTNDDHYALLAAFLAALSGALRPVALEGDGAFGGRTTMMTASTRG